MPFQLVKMLMYECTQVYLFVQQQLMTLHIYNSIYIYILHKPNISFGLSVAHQQSYISVSISLQAAEKLVTDSKELTVTSGLS